MPANSDTGMSKFPSHPFRIHPEISYQRQKALLKHLSKVLSSLPVQGLQMSQWWPLKMVTCLDILGQLLSFPCSPTLSLGSRSGVPSDLPGTSVRKTHDMFFNNPEHGYSHGCSHQRALGRVFQSLSRKHSRHWTFQWLWGNGIITRGSHSQNLNSTVPTSGFCGIQKGKRKRN